MIFENTYSIRIGCREYPCAEILYQSIVQYRKMTDAKVKVHQRSLFEKGSKTKIGYLNWDSLYSQTTGNEFPHPPMQNAQDPPPNYPAADLAALVEQGGDAVISVDLPVIVSMPPKHMVAAQFSFCWFAD